MTGSHRGQVCGDRFSHKLSFPSSLSKCPLNKSWRQAMSQRYLAIGEYVGCLCRRRVLAAGVLGLPLQAE